ncbi:MAG: methionine--tRNA ligase, partial [Acidimicrobiia bacterium]
WTLLRDGGDLDAARAVLAPLVGAVRVIAAEIEPFVPALAGRVRARIGLAGEPVVPGSPLQPRLGTA